MEDKNENNRGKCSVFITSEQQSQYFLHKFLTLAIVLSQKSWR